MRTVSLYIACSIDGYIARKDGRVDWLFSDADYGYKDFLQGIGTIVMGRTTYDQLLTFGDYPYGGKEVFVASRSRAGQKDEHVTFVGPEIAEKIRDLRTSEGEGKGIWLVGGAQLVRLFVFERLIDEIIVSIHPVILGSGIPLFLPQDSKTWLDFINCTSFPSGLVQLTYRVKPQYRNP
jgi:dihydrofolate reductase